MNTAREGGPAIDEPGPPHHADGRDVNGERAVAPPQWILTDAPGRRRRRRHPALSRTPSPAPRDHDRQLPHTHPLPLNTKRRPVPSRNRRRAGQQARTSSTAGSVALDDDDGYAPSATSGFLLAPLSPTVA
ncbi:hypothetical protein SAMD00023353_0401000 [Rosellinia necatrix]|uniref:Uncharacterized protein n=1 Tax=Rosellinia necatrix TaxID=77044 RepID=A0A1S8A593_ROSNE|nr:hypothetical protein SAMD00023353_0401000 [Rosellinia necatrix]